MGDDAVGLFVVEELAARSWPAGVEFVQATSCAPDIFFSMSAGRPWQRGESVELVIVDALEMGHSPGTVSVLKFDEFRMEPDGRDPPVSMHTFSVIHLLGALRLAGMEPESVTVVGIEPARIEPADGLSSQLRLAWDSVVDVCAGAVMNRLRKDTT